MRGYYDTRGDWIEVAPNAGAYGAPAGYEGGQQRDIDRQEAWIEQRIHSAANNGLMNRYDAAQDLNRLDLIRSQERSLRDSEGRLSPADEAGLQARLDRLSASLRQSVNGAGF